MRALRLFFLLFLLLSECFNSVIHSLLRLLPQHRPKSAGQTVGQKLPESTVEGNRLLLGWCPLNIVTVAAASPALTLHEGSSIGGQLPKEL